MSSEIKCKQDIINKFKDIKILKEKIKQINGEIESFSEQIEEKFDRLAEMIILEYNKGNLHLIDDSTFFGDGGQGYFSDWGHCYLSGKNVNVFHGDVKNFKLGEFYTERDNYIDKNFIVIDTNDYFNLKICDDEFNNMNIQRKLYGRKFYEYEYDSDSDSDKQFEEFEEMPQFEFVKFILKKAKKFKLHISNSRHEAYYKEFDLTNFFCELPNYGSDSDDVDMVSSDEDE